MEIVPPEIVPAPDYICIMRSLKLNNDYPTISHIFGNNFLLYQNSVKTSWLKLCKLCPKPNPSVEKRRESSCKD